MPDADASELLERSPQLETLETAFAAVRGGSGGRLELVGGEAGVGKTSLLRRFCLERQDAARVLWGSCDALFTPGPLGPFRMSPSRRRGSSRRSWRARHVRTTSRRR